MTKLLRTFKASLLLASALLASASANALLIDFTSNTWAGAHGQSTFTTAYGDLDVTLRAVRADGSAGVLRFFSFDGDAADAPCGSLLACERDGAGIGDDEITFGVGGMDDVERLVVSFSGRVDVDGIHFLDLFAAGGSPSDPLVETAQWYVNNSTGGTLEGTAFGDGTGYALADVLYSDVFQIEFFADTARTASSSNTDFALAAISVVPIPGAVVLFGSALMLLAGFGGRKRRTTRHGV